MKKYTQVMPMRNEHLKQEILEVQLITPKGGKMAGKRVFSYMINGIPKESFVVAPDASLAMGMKVLIPIMCLEATQ